MEKKTKMLLGIAACALAAGLALSAGSCVARTAGQAGAPDAAATEQGQRDPGSREATAFERACSKDWRAGDSSLQLSRGMLVERDGEGTLHVLTISDVSEEDAGDQALISVTGTDEDSQAGATWTLVLDEEGGAATLSSDGFKASKSYSESVAAGSFSVEGIDEAYIGLVGGDVDPLREALAAYARANVPQAASASFDGEAFVDFGARSVSATFHADDPVRTILTVTYANGAFAVAG